MDTYIAEATVEGSGSLRLEHLPFKAGQRVHVELSAVQNLASEWPEGYFTATFGAILDETFIRPPQGEFESRESFD